MGTITVKQFVAAPGARFGDEKAQKYGERLEELRDEENILDPHVVVRDAEQDQSPLHDYFEWDDSKAAYKFRVHQARSMIRSIQVIVPDDPAGEDKPVKAWHHVRVENKQASYISIDDASESEDYLAQIEEDALTRLRYWRDQYRMRSEKLQKLADAIDKAESRIMGKQEKREE